MAENNRFDLTEGDPSKADYFAGWADPRAGFWFNAGFHTAPLGENDPVQSIETNGVGADLCMAAVSIAYRSLVAHGIDDQRAAEIAEGVVPRFNYDDLVYRALPALLAAITDSIEAQAVIIAQEVIEQDI